MCVRLVFIDNKLSIKFECVIWDCYIWKARKEGGKSEKVERLEGESALVVNVWWEGDFLAGVLEIE